ncbi:MAG TPA: HisA/HisF-related TIM barrel protein [Gemmatimonadaceae bacterium]
MIVIPTLELRRGACLRSGPHNGGNEAASPATPVAVARSWANAGFQRLHVIDADAESGAGTNAELVEDIVRDGVIEVQVSGGIQSTDQIERLVDTGAASVIVGLRGIEDPRWLASVAETFPGQLMVGTDVRERRVVTRGWVHNVPLDIFDVLAELDSLPLAGLLLSAADANGHRTVSDLALLEDVAESCGFPVMAAGGVSTMNDLRALEHRGVAAAVLGSALYDGELDSRTVAQEFGGSATA